MDNEPANGTLLSHRDRSRTVQEFIQNIINENNDETHVVFCQLDTLTKKDNEQVWLESARWVKYEEDVEENGKRWSKPHVASITLHNVFELKVQLKRGVIMLDCDARSVAQLADNILSELARNNNNMTENSANAIRSTILKRHMHPHLKRRRDSTSQKRKDYSANEFSNMKGHNRRGENGHDIEKTPLVKLNKPYMKKIPKGAEVSNVWVGEMEDLKEPITAFVRLTEARNIGDLTEVPLPTRFIFLHLAPPGEPGHMFELGRAMSTMMVDEIFCEVAYKAKSREDILHAMDEFLDQVTVLPPGQWDPSIRLEPPGKVPSQAKRRETIPSIGDDGGDEHGDSSLERSGRLFGGLVADVKRKLPHYFSDFKAGLHVQCLGSILFMYLATLTPNITFGALLGHSTNNVMGPMECIVAIAIVNICWALFSGQPLIIMGSTGPVLVLEIIIYNMSRDNDWDFFTFRCLIGLWVTLILLVMVAFDLSSLVRYITRFTEESFACLISIIFIVEAFKKIFAVSGTHPYNIHPEIPLDYTCFCSPPNTTYSVANMTDINLNAPYVTNNSMGLDINWTAVDKKMCTKLGGVLEGSGCDTIVYHDNVFFLSFILGIGTFFVAWTLVNMKRSSFFPTVVRQTLGDFAVFLSICCMIGLDAGLGVPTPKLTVPDTIRPSVPRPWFVGFYHPKNPWWLYPATLLPALVAVILIFMDQQITAVIVNRKENKLKKGCGYHLDLMVCLICIAVCSLFGLPWYVAATVRSMAHVNSLKMESECSAPGEKPEFLGIRENRLTGLIVAIMNGCSVFMTPLLTIIPMPVLYGVFMYMGVSALRGMQLVDRILIMFMPVKYQPDHVYLRHVRIKRVHLFTIIQILCLAILWAIKAIKTISIVFPVMVLGTCVIRKVMEKFFTQNELRWLDELMPEDKIMKQEDDGELIVDESDDKHLAMNRINGQGKGKFFLDDNNGNNNV